METRRVLFICSHNSARSQMAEGLLRHLAGDAFEAYSAGIEAGGLRPDAVRAMSELGIDIGDQRSETLEPYLDQPFDWVITVCDEARQACPTFPGTKRTEHWSFEDPSGATGSPEERLAVFRRVRDEIADRVREFAARAVSTT